MTLLCHFYTGTVVNLPSQRATMRSTATHVLQISQDVFANAIFVEFGLNGSNDFVYNSAVDGRLKNFSVT